MTDDGLEHCGIKGCRVFRDPKARVPQPTFMDVEWIRAAAGYMRPLCQVHYAQAMEVERDLPLAIMEFHAWALLHTPYKSEAQFNSLGAAEDRVVRLRELEALLKGGE